MGLQCPALRLPQPLDPRSATGPGSRSRSNGPRVQNLMHNLKWQTSSSCAGRL